MSEGEAMTPLTEAEGQYPLSFIERHRALRMAATAGEPVVGTCFPPPAYLAERLHQLHGSVPELVPIVAEDLYDYIAERRLQAEARGARFDESNVSGSAARRERESGAGGPGEALLRSALEDAVANRASDVHLVPGREDAAIWLRVDGALIRRRRVSRELCERMTARLKALVRGNAAQRRRPQEGRFERSIGGETYELRLSLLPGMHGESVALRLLGVARGGMSLCELRFGAEVERFLRAMTRRSDGLFLVTGPTGSGKTTTLHAMARLILADGRRIVTIEDPVEYELSGALQLQVNRALKLDFDVLLTRALRHDPDVLLVGEVRDAETAALAVRAALTGHLVLASMHTGTATTAVLRLANLGCAQGELSAALCGVLSQRLLRCATAGRVPVAGVLADPADLSGVWDGAAPSAGATGTAGAAGDRAPSRGGPAAGGPATARIIGRGWRMRALGEDVRRVVRAGLVTEAEARRALPPGRWGEP